MSNSVSYLDLISASQANKEITANNLFDAGSAATLLGRRASTSSGLIFGLYGGVKSINGTPTQVPSQNVTLTPSATNYIYENLGEVVCTTTMPVGWPGPMPGYAVAVYEVLTGADAPISWTDWRSFGGLVGGAGATGPAGPQGDAGPAGPEGPPGADGGASILAAKGDLLVRSALDLDRLPVGTEGMVLVAAPNTPLGMQWAIPDAYTRPFDVQAFYPGTLPAQAVITRIPVARTVTFPLNLGGSFATASFGATAIAYFTVRKNDVTVATVTFAPGQLTGTFSSTAAFDFFPGDTLSIVAPLTPDITLADVGFAIAGARN